jgi:hypothetical protein
MKLPTLLFIIVFAPIPAFAQQTTTYQVCTTYKENYVPGGYDRYGNYQQGYVDTQSYQSPCGGSRSYGRSYSSPEQSYRPCASTGVGAIVGAGVAGAISKPDAMPWSIPLGILGGAIVGDSFCE